VTAALAGTRWGVLEALSARSAADEPARVIVEELQYAARHDQHAANLVAALEKAVDEAAGLLAARREVELPPGGGGSESVPDGDRTRTVADLAGWKRVAAEIRGEVEAAAR
jgi:hypothetical protein